MSWIISHVAAWLKLFIAEASSSLMHPSMSLDRVKIINWPLWDTEFRGVEQSIFYILLLELPLVGCKWLPALLFLNRQVLEVKIIPFSFTLRSPATHVLPWHRQDYTCLPGLRPEVALVWFSPCQNIPWATLKSLSPRGSSKHKLSSRFLKLVLPP